MKLAKVLTSISAAFVTLMVASAAFAQEAGANAVAFGDRDKWIGVAIGFGMAFAAFGGALAQGRASAAALDGIARNPGAADKVFTPLILCLALIESLVIYSLVISFMRLGKVH